MRVMISSFSHKGLERYYKSGNVSGIQPKHGNRLRLMLSNLDQGASSNDMDMPGLRLHELKGSRAGFWSVVVSGNWRITFRFAGRNAEKVNYEDCH